MVQIVFVTRTCTRSECMTSALGRDWKRPRTSLTLTSFPLAREYYLSVYLEDAFSQIAHGKRRSIRARIINDYSTSFLFFPRSFECWAVSAQLALNEEIKGRALGRPEIQSNSKLSRARYQLSSSYLYLLSLLTLHTIQQKLATQTTVHRDVLLHIFAPRDKR